MVALTFFWGLYPHVFIRKRALSANKALNWLALCWGLYLQIKPSIVNARLQTRSCCVGVVLVEGFIIPWLKGFNNIVGFFIISRQIVNDFVGSFFNYP
jgi:hypothetical protein